MLTKIPDSQTSFIRALKWNFEDAAYKAPEETLQWERTQKTLMINIPKPLEMWEFEVLSIFTTKSIEELKDAINREREKSVSDGKESKT